MLSSVWQFEWLHVFLEAEQISFHCGYCFIYLAKLFFGFSSWVNSRLSYSPVISLQFQVSDLLVLCFPKLTGYFWDIKKVINFLIISNTPNELSLKDLTLKLAILLSVTPAARVSEICFLDTVFPLISAGPHISAAPLGIYIEISASPLISAASINAALIRILTIFH